MMEMGNILGFHDCVAQGPLESLAEWPDAIYEDSSCLPTAAIDIEDITRPIFSGLRFTGRTLDMKCDLNDLFIHKVQLSHTREQPRLSAAHQVTEYNDRFSQYSM
jgi:hypothetical protein